MPNVSFKRLEVQKIAKSYELIRDALTGEVAVKQKGARYLPPPQSIEDKEGQDRYTSYITRAVFYNVSKRTLQGLLGQLFSRQPLITVPAYLANTVANMNGLGVNATQQCKNTSSEVIAYGRAGLLSDFPTLPNGQEATAADLQSGRVAATITFYKADQIINWRYNRDYTGKKLMFVILEEDREIIKEGEFTSSFAKQYRVCRLDASGYYVQELYYDNKSSPVKTSAPIDYNGDRFDSIPFEFIGSEDNDPDIDDPPMYSIASLNIAHYRNSADFEDSLFYVGQPTVAITGLSQAWVDQNLTGKLRLGSRNAIPLPSGGDLKIVQADPNNLSKEGMDQKERQMVALGAKLVENKQVQRTATEASQDETAESSILQTAADNTSVAYAQAFATAGRFYAEESAIDFKINTAFEIATLDYNARAETIKEWQMGAISFPEMRQVLRRCGIATLDDDEAKAQIDKEQQERAAALDADPTNIQEPAGNNDGQ